MLSNPRHQADHFLHAQCAQIHTHGGQVVAGDIDFDTAQRIHDLTLQGRHGLAVPEDQASKRVNDLHFRGMNTRNAAIETVDYTGHNSSMVEAMAIF
jgi:hypothetical protein